MLRRFQQVDVFGTSRASQSALLGEPRHAAWSLRPATIHQDNDGTVWVQGSTVTRITGEIDI